MEAVRKRRRKRRRRFSTASRELSLNLKVASGTREPTRHLTPASSSSSSSSSSRPFTHVLLMAVGGAELFSCRKGTKRLHCTTEILTRRRRRDFGLRMLDSLMIFVVIRV
ncbi:hypothetical protein E2C01_037678 [Portunus trituberculatus]|uniref:Uncharacterized protein n=1 Tax=Portunus trituberculatus TaxID=210409 RepID=A0A5B7FFL0_PORTR|nr:hypothetical protein [Portunus trituberculatus]